LPAGWNFFLLNKIQAGDFFGLFFLVKRGMRKARAGVLKNNLTVKAKDYSEAIKYLKKRVSQ